MPIFTPNQKAAFEFFCNHLIAIRVRYHAINGRVETFVGSCTLLRYGDDTFLLTASHVVSILELLADQTKVSIDLIDIYGSKAKSSMTIPFTDFCFTADKFRCVGDNPDIGCITVHPMVMRLLENNGIVPFHLEQMYDDLDESQALSHYMLIGFPAELVQNSVPEPVLISVHRTYKTNDIERFVGLIDTGQVIDSIVGTSGGPIIGISSDFQYYLVAIQSGWTPPHEIYGGPSARIVSMFERIRSRPVAT